MGDKNQLYKDYYEALYGKPGEEDRFNKLLKALEVLQEGQNKQKDDLCERLEIFCKQKILEELNKKEENLEQEEENLEQEEENLEQEEKESGLIKSLKCMRWRMWGIRAWPFTWFVRNGRRYTEKYYNWLLPWAAIIETKIPDFSTSWTNNRRNFDGMYGLVEAALKVLDTDNGNRSERIKENNQLSENIEGT